MQKNPMISTIMSAETLISDNNEQVSSIPSLATKFGFSTYRHNY